MKYLLSLIVPVFFCAVCVAQTNNFWVQKANFEGGERERASAFSVGNYGYVTCGVDSAEMAHNDLWRFDPAVNSWSQMADLPGVERRNAVAASLDGKGYVGTGIDDISNTNLTDWWEYDPSVNLWAQKSNYPGGGAVGLAFATAFSVNDRVHICGGKIGPSNYLAELWEYNPINDHWIRLGDFPGGERSKLTSFSVGDRAYVGLGQDEDVYKKDIWEFDSDINVWFRRADFPGGERASASTFSLGDRGYVMFGESGGYHQDLWEYNPVADVWINRANYPAQERRYAIAFSIGNTGYAGIGQGSSGKKRSFYEYTPPLLTIGQYELMDLNLYPNPCIGKVSIDLPDGFIGELQVYDMAGKLVLRSSNVNWIDLTNVQSGAYLVRLLSENNKTVGRTKLMVR